jgi:DNA-binding transcriptional regulator YiaG
MPHQLLPTRTGAFGKTSALVTIRNWEQGKRCPTGAAKALLKVLDKAPEAALAALN